MKKHIVSIIAAFLVAVPFQSQAGIGLVSLITIFGGPGSIVLIKLGGALTAASLATAWAVERGGTRHAEDTVLGALSIPGFFLGLILMDDKGAFSAQYGSLSEQEAASIGIKHEEYVNYMAELDHVDAISQTIDQKLKRMEHPTLEDSKALWNEARQELSPEAFLAVAKISKHAVDEINAR